MNESRALGLSSAEAAERLSLYGPNELPNPDRRTILRIVAEVLRQPMFALLLGGLGIYLFLGQLNDAIALAIFALLSIAISIVQEARSERVLQSLGHLASPRALVIRDGVHRRIAGRDVVPDDIILLSEGDRVPADAILVRSNEMLVDESLLTGESVPVRKRATTETVSWQAPGGDDLPFTFAGTLVARGTGMARVTGTGLRSEMGKIGQSLQSVKMEQPRLQKQLNWLVRNFALAGLAVAGLTVLLFGLLRDSWLAAALGGVAIAMSVLPEEIPLILSVFMAMGAWRIARARVLTRRAAAIETLGSATVLCTDKTGTLTENRMRVELVVTKEEVWRRESASAMSENIKSALDAGFAASAAEPTDPMDKAIHEISDTASAFRCQSILRTYGLGPDLFATTNVWVDGDGHLTAYTKGAPEAIAELCKLPEEQRLKITQEANRYAAEGIRLLAVAKSTLVQNATLPQSQRDIRFDYLGMLGFADPLRPNVPAAVAECRSAGVRVIMITGDYPATARAIAERAGIDAGIVVAGDDLELLSDRDLAKAAKVACVFARIRPQQKLRLVEALKRDGEIVAMTGDGVNDSPALKTAHIGISMGGRGTDVAREASSLVLLDDDFASVVKTIRLGRRIYDNIRKAINYTVAVHVPIAGLALLPLVFGFPLMLMPIHIALLEMIIDPACSIVFEAEREEKDIMRRPPRKPDLPIISRQAVLWATVQGAAALALLATMLVTGWQFGMHENDLRALVFTALVLMNVGLLVVNRSFRSSIAEAVLRPNPALWGLVIPLTVVLGVALYWAPARALFQFGPLHVDDLAVCIAAIAGVVVLLEVGKSIGFGRVAAY